MTSSDVPEIGFHEVNMAMRGCALAIIDQGLTRARIAQGLRLEFLAPGSCRDRLELVFELGDVGHDERLLVGCEGWMKSFLLFLVTFALVMSALMVLGSLGTGWWFLMMGVFSLGCGRLFNWGNELWRSRRREVDILALSPAQRAVVVGILEDVRAHGVAKSLLYVPQLMPGLLWGGYV